MFVRLEGGLGNQMFQAAFGWSTAKKYDCPVYFEKRGLGPGRHRAYGLDVFKRNVEFRTPPAQAVVCRESTFAFDPNVYRHISNYTLFTGNFQTERYFDEELVRSAFVPLEPLSPASQRWVDQLRQDHTCSIHVRRTDYTIASTARYHGLATMDYYRAAIQYIKARTTDIKFFVFSDEPEWCRHHFVGSEFQFVDANGFGSGDQGPATEHEDIALMSMCKHGIMPNSSFSWWGNWLNRDRLRMVIALKDWFNPDGPAKDFDTSDICPQRWVRL